MNDNTFRSFARGRWLLWSGALMVCVLCGCSDDRSAASEGDGPCVPEPSAPQVRNAAAGRGTSARRAVRGKEGKKPLADIDGRTDLSPTDKAVLHQIEDAQEKESAKALRVVIPAALRSGNAEVRSAAVDALGWFGKATMDELLPFMADADEEVSERAVDQWTAALGEIEDEQARCRLLEGVMKILRKPETLEALVTELSNCEDKFAMQVVVDLIASNNDAAAKVAREHYEFMTGDEYTTIEAADKWLRENADEKEED